MEARDSDSDEEDMDLAKMRERQAAIAAAEKEEARCRAVQYLVAKFVTHAHRPHRCTLTQRALGLSQ